MDVRQFVFQVRQPPAALSAERFWGMPKRGLAFLLANAMFWQPLWVQANGIVINAPGTGLEHAGNGVPIVNIAAPNASGLSHNQFRDYNVGSEGVILNNATGRTQATQLGGIILGNPNLGGRAASTILNEVNGGNPSQLRGYTEVAGQSARVIVANPYGISCNGCGFINTPRVTLTTGKPVFNNGQLDHYKVDGGSVFIDGAGLNATNVDSFEIITRSAKINAEIHANKLSIVAGRNDVDAQSLNAVARTNDGSAKPELAIDSSALGGMYSGAIKLVATEAGVGVRLAGNLAASGGDIQIDANGNLSLAQAASTHAINIKAASLEAQGPVYAGSTLDVQTSGALSNQRSLAAGDRISLSSGGQLSNNGIIEAGANADSSRNTRGDISLSAQNLRNTGTVVASRNLDARVSQTFDNSGGLMGSVGLLTASAANLVNRLGSLSSGGRLSFTSSGGIDNKGGRLVTDASLDLRSASLDNRQQGNISGKNSVQVNTGTFDNSQGGRLNSGANLNLKAAQLNNNSGTLSGSAIAIDFGSATGDLNNAGGLITTAGQLSIRHLRDLNNANGEISSHQSYTLAGRTLDNHAGKLISNQQLNLDASSILNQNGLISGWEGLSVTTDTLDNRNHGTLSSRNGDVTGNVSGDLLNSGAGALVSQQHLTVNAGSLDNSSGGILSSAGDQALTVQGLLNNTQGGLIDSGGALTLQTMALDNTYGAVSAQRAVSFTGTTLDNSHGNLIGNAAITLNLLGVLTNSNGKLASTGPLLLQHASQINNQGGQLASQGLMTVLIGGLDNRNGGTVAANEHLILTASGAVQNSDDGLIYSQHGDLRLHAASLANSLGTLQSQGEMNLEVVGDIDNRNGRIIAQSGDLNLTAANVDNRGGVLSSLQATLSGFLGGWLKNGYGLLNHKGGNTQAEHLNLTALGGIDNQGGRLAAQSGDAVINTAYLDNREGGLYAAHAVGVTGGALDNSAGQIMAQKIDLSLTGALSNRKGIIESNNILTLNTASIDNQFGQLRALGTSGASRFLIGGQFDNRNGTLESANTDLHLAAGNFMNTGGTVLHVGSGSFDIATANVLNAGGSLVTRGGLTLNADSWTNTGIIQAGRLTLNVNNFAQTTTGQLLASDNLYATGVNWSNDGLIASDGDLHLGLSGAYNGTGRLTSRGDLNLQAGQLTLAESASIASGGDGLINVASLLSNRGRLTSAGDLTVYAGNLNNHGTLGSGQDLTLTTNALLNDHGLIFSGWDMGLRVASLSNSYASIYSLGDLDIDRDGNGGWATSIVNSSGLIQSDGSMSLAASTIQNIRALLTISDNGIYTAKIEQIPCVKGVNAGDCSGKQNRVWEITQRDKLDVTAASATVSVINNGGNLGAVLKDVTSSDALKGYAISGLTAGMTAGYFNDWTGTTTDPVTGKISTNLGTWRGVGQFAASQGLQNGTSAALSKIMGQGGDLGDALQSTLFNTLAAASFNAVGDYTKDVFADGSVPKIFIHAMVGGLLAEVSGGDFKTGALAAGANEALVDQLNTWVDGDKNLLNMTSQLVGMLAAATQSGADAESLQTGAWVAQNATQYNFFDHMPPGLSEYGQAATSLAEYMQGQGATAEDITQAQLALAQGQGFDGVQPANEFVKAWGIFMAGELAGIGVGAVLGAKATGEVAATVLRTPLAGPTGNWKNYTHAEAVIQTQASGRLVNAEKAVIDPSKVTSYALNTAHPVGGNKAKVFESALGYNQTNAASLITKVQEGATRYPAKLGASDKFGQRITIDMPITGPNGNTATVRTGWIYDPGSATPRMTTLYVK